MIPTTDHDSARGRLIATLGEGAVAKFQAGCKNNPKLVKILDRASSGDLTKDEVAYAVQEARKVWGTGPRYDDLKDLYRSPQGFADWNQIARSMVFQCSEYMELHAALAQDVTARTVSAVCESAIADHTPVRYISRDLCESFQRTPFPGLSQELLEVFPSLIIVLPKGSLISDDGYDLSHLVIRTGQVHPHTVTKDSARRRFDLRCQGREGAIGIMVAGFTELSSYSWIRYLKPEFNENLYVQNGSDKVLSVTEAIARIAVNSLLVHLHEPELITADTKVTHLRGTGFAAGRSSKTRPPTWIGKNFRRVTGSSNTSRPSGSASRGPVRTHWRRGHWHTIAHGEGRKQRKMQWFRPVLVNARG